MDIHLIARYILYIYFSRHHQIDVHPRKKAWGGYYVIILIRDFHLQGTVNNDIRRPAAADSVLLSLYRQLRLFHLLLLAVKIDQSTKQKNKIKY